VKHVHNSSKQAANYMTLVGFEKIKLIRHLMKEPWRLSYV